MINKVSRRPVFAAVTTLCMVVVGLFAGAAPAQAASTVPTWISVLSGAAVGPKVIDIRARSTANTARAQLWDRIPGTAGDNQIWTIIPVPVSGSSYKAYNLRNKLSGKCLDKRSDVADVNGSQVQQYTCNSQPQQLWFFIGGFKSNAAWGELWNSADGRCLDAVAPGDSNGTPLQVWDCSGADNQRWNIS